MRDESTTPEPTSEPASAKGGADPLASFRSEPGNAKLFTDLHRRLKESGDLAALAELLELRAAHESDRLKAANQLAEAAEARLEGGEAGPAEVDFRAALERDPAHKRAAARYTEHLIGHRRYAEAAAVIEAEVEVLSERAEASDSKGKKNGKGEAFAARRADRHAALAALWQEHLGRVDRALHNWQRAWQLEPHRTDALEAARGIYASLGDDAMVVRLYESELSVLGQRAKDKSAKQKGAKQRRAEIHKAIGELRARAGETEKAAESLEQALKLDPSQTRARETLADLYASPAFAEDDERRERAADLFVELGHERLRQEDFDGAIRFLRRALGVDPYSKAAARDLAAALGKSERWHELERLFVSLAETAGSGQEKVELLERRCALYREHTGDREALKDALAELVEIPEAGPQHSVELRELLREDEDWSRLADLIVAESASLDPNSREFAREMLELATIEREYLRNRDRAAEAIHRILQHNPQQEEALARYADHFRERRDWRGLADLGEFALEKVAEAGAEPAELIRRLEELALLYERRLGDLSRAVTTWQRILEIEPGSKKASEAIGRLSSREKTWQSLIGVLEAEAEAARSPAERAEVLRRIAQTYRERHFNPGRAVKLYEEILEMFPDDAASLKAVADLYDREGNEAGLAHTLRRQLELDARELDRQLAQEHGGRPPTTREWPVQKRVERINTLRRLASMYEDRLADVDGVVFACSGILELLPGDRDALTRMERVLERSEDLGRLEQTLEYHAAAATGPAERAKVLRKLARLAAGRDDEVAAMERWEQVLQAAPNDREALEALAGLYDRHQRWGELAGVLERVVLAPAGASDASAAERETRAARLRRYAQVVDEKLGDSGRAIKAWRKLLEQMPVDREALEALARLFEGSGQWRELVAILTALLPIYKEDGSERAAECALRRASLLEERLGAPADAAAALEELIGEIDPTNLAGHKALRRLYEGRGDFDSAVRVAEREIYLADEPRAKIARGLEIGFLCRDRLGDPTRALQAFERVLELDPEHREALQAAGELYAAVGNWKRHVELLEDQLERVKAGRERRSLMLRVAQTTAERLGDHKEAFLWYRRAHNHAPDPSTLAELRRAAEAYGLWREMIEIYEEERGALANEDGVVADKPSYVEFSREIASVAEQRLNDPARAIEAIREALAVQPRSEALLSEAERIAESSDTAEIWRAYLECIELPMVGMERSAKVATLLTRARVHEERLDDGDGAVGELLKAFAWQPDNAEVIDALRALAERQGRWEDLLSAMAARFERAPTRERRLAALREKAEVIENHTGDRVRAFRVHLSGFLLAPEDSETLAHLWRLAREIGSYTEDQQIPEPEPPAARVEPPEASRVAAPPAAHDPAKRVVGATVSSGAKPGVTPTTAPKADPTMELTMADLLAARDATRALATLGSVEQGELDDGRDDQRQSASDRPALPGAPPEGDEPAGEREIPPPGVGDRTQPLDISDLMEAEGRVRPATPPRDDPTMQLRTEDLIEALGARAPQGQLPSAPPARPKRPTASPPPPPPPPPSIQRSRRASAPPPPAPAAPRVVPAPAMPRRRYASPWDELSSAYELLPTPSPAMKLRWLFRSAEVQEIGAGEIDRAFDILAKALEIAPDKNEAKDRLHRLAEAHEAWDRLAELYSRAADDAGTAEAAASFLLDVAEIRTQQGRPLETESIYRRILGMRPEDDLARSKLENLYRQEKRWIDLAASLEERTDPRLGSAAPEPERPRLLRELADVYQDELGRPHDAIDALDRLRKLVPEDTEVLSTLADLHGTLGRWSKVIDCLQKLADVAEDGPEAREALHRIASIYEDKLELFDRAIDAYSQLVEQWPDDGEAYEALDRLYQAHGRWEELSSILRRRAALTREPDKRAELLGRRAAVLLDWLDAPDEAAAALRHARTILPHDDELGDRLVTALTRAGREREAAAVLEGRIAALRDRGDESPGTLAALLIRLGSLRVDVIGDPEGARAAFDEALELVPDHPTALAAHSRLARDDRDPRGYADALLKQAEVVSDQDSRVDALMEAGRVLQDECDDPEAARAAFERVLEMRPFHSQATWALAGLVEQGGDLDSAASLLTKRLEDESLDDVERAHLLTRLAGIARRAGVDPVAEHRLDEALAVVSDHTPAIIAKADLLYELRRYDQLLSFLAEVIPVVDDTDASISAALRRRLAAVYDEQGRPDEAYQVLLEADRSRRGDVLIKLALGENRYRARRWREAALHLGALAEHPDADHYPSEVAEGLYHAALAEIRSLRPHKAGPLYERAVELKPNYAPALHALAELAMEQGDSQRAADLLTRQASATTDPEERLRMFEALGDMAMMTLGDEERARTCYQAAVNAASPLDETHVPLLEKLLELQDLASDSAGMARTAELLASFASAASERAARLTLAAEGYHAAGQKERAEDAASRAVSASPYDLMAVSIDSQLAMKRADVERVAAVLGRALGSRKEHDELSAPREALLWNRLGEARLARNDHKGAMKAFEQAVSVASDSDGAMSARRHLLELWKDSGDTKSRLVEYHRTLASDSRELEDLAAYARALGSAREYDGAVALLQLARALGFELSEDDLVFLRKHPIRVMAADEAYSGTVDDELHRSLVGETDFALMGRVMSTLWQSASLVFSDTESALWRRGLSSAERIGSSSGLPAAAIFTRVANALKVPATLLYRAGDDDAPDVTVVCSSPPVVVLGERLCRTGDDAVSEDELRFLLARAAEMARPENVIAGGLTQDELAELMDSIQRAFGRDEENEAARTLKTTLPVRTRQPLAELVAKATGGDLDPESYRHAVSRKADRMGYLLSADPEISLALADQREGHRHLVEMALRPEFVEARRVLGVGVLG